MNYILLFAIAIIAFMVMNVLVLHVRTGLDLKTARELDIREPGKDIAKEWDSLSWAGTNPWRVIALAQKMREGMTPFKGAMHMASSFYSQVKFLLKRGKLPSAIAYFLESRKYSRKAEELVRSGSKEATAISCEVIGAQYFFFAKFPVVGPFLGIFGFRANALEWLLRADNMLKEQPVNEPLESAIIWSKLYALTKNETYRIQVRAVGLRRDMKEGQLKRIAKWLGFSSLDELFTFCKI